MRPPGNLNGVVGKIVRISYLVGNRIPLGIQQCQKRPEFVSFGNST